MSTQTRSLGRVICPQQSHLTKSGIVFAITDFSEDGWRSSGKLEVKANDPDFRFWKWLHANCLLLPPVMDEVHVPALKKFAATLSPAAVLKVPSDGIYLNCESNGPVVSEAIEALVAAVGQSSITNFQPSAATTDEYGMMRVFCRGLAEVFVFQDGRCEFFGAIGKYREGITMNIRLIAKRAPATPDSARSAPRG
ncbi:MAG: hypothetical protein ABL974_00250 [Prosthecobacter sp.]